MEISAKMVKDLRDKTGVGMMDCKKALVNCDGDMEKAADWLREKGLADAAKKASRIAAEGAVGSYIHMGGKIGVLVEINCETDFVAKTDEFKELMKDVAMQIAASNPRYVRREEVPADEVEKETEILTQQAVNEGKPVAIAEKMVVGRISKFYKNICLLEQPFVKDPDITVEEMLKSKIARIGENLTIRRFVRYEMGEGLQKRQDDFVNEVMNQAKG